MYIWGLEEVKVYSALCAIYIESERTWSWMKIDVKQVPNLLE